MKFRNERIAKKLLLCERHILIGEVERGGREMENRFWRAITIETIEKEAPQYIRGAKHRRCTISQLSVRGSQTPDIR